MLNDGQIVFQVTADGKHAIADIKEITRAIQQETGKWDTAAKQSTDNMSNNFSGMLKKLVAGFSAVKIGKALLDIGSAAVSAASDLQEVQNVVDVTFGESAGVIDKWAKSASTQFGLTETMAKKFSSTMGAMLKSSGLAGDQIVDVSTDLAGLAADMASFYNLDFDEAFSKIRSGMSGMTMPLKELGIDMSVDTMNAFALAQGLDKTFSQMTQGEQTMLRYQYLMSVTSDAQGDFARTSDGYANSVRQLQSNVEKLKTSLGTTFIGIASQAVGAINEFIKLLYPDESKKTIIEQFNDIDIDTQKKLDEIQKVADEAGALIEQLNVISGTNVDEAIKKFAEGANVLDSSSPATWKALLSSLKTVDGLTNLFDDNAGEGIESLANALSGAELDTNKADAWKTFLGALAENAEAVSSLTGTSAEETKKWLEGIADSVDKINPDDVDAWDKLLTSLAQGFTATPEGEKFVESLASQFLALGSDSQAAVKGLEALGFNSDQISDKQKAWLQTCKDLVKTIPGLSSVINTETGEVTGGIGALNDYVKEWKETQEKLAHWKAYYAKEDAQRQTQDQIYGLEVSAGGARRAANRARDEYEKALNDLNLEVGVDFELVNWEQVDGGIEKMQELQGLEEKWVSTEKEATAAEEEYNKAVDNNKEAIQKLADEHDYLTEKYGEEARETKAVTKEMTLLEKAAAKDADALEQVQTAVNNTNDALKEMADYAESVHKSVESAVDSTVSGFKEIETPMMASRKKIKELEKSIYDLDTSSKDYEKDLKKINDEIAKQRGEQISAQSMNQALKQQAEYMETYLRNLRKARTLGFSDEVLSALSDGSEQSYDYLEQLAKATPAEVEEINKNYDKVIAKKKELSDELSNQQLTVDQTYQSLVEKAKQAISELNMEDEAAKNAGYTISGIAQGISSKVPEVQAAVDAIVEQLNRLEGFDINVGLGSFGSINILKPNGGANGRKTAEGTFATGADWIPHDNYIARLHEGERVLTAQENQIWNAIRNGGISGVDYDTIGGVMRDNVKPGGNVYLDGKVVGNVISDRQGKTYKSLQRSGWQA